MVRDSLKRYHNCSSKVYNKEQWTTAETDVASGSLTGEYIYGAEGMIAKFSPDEPDLMYFYTDHLGSVRQVEQNTQLRDYYPFGQTLSSAGDETAYRFTGKELDAHTGLYYFGAMYYG